MANKRKKIELQERDEAVLVACRDLTILSLDQLRRLYWPDGGRETARKRLSVLMNHGQRWLANLTVSKPVMAAAGLEPGMVYHLSKTGQRWFRRQDRPPGHGYRRQQIIHDLLISEIYVRLVELARQCDPLWVAEWHPGWSARFYRRRSDDRPLLIPDGLGILKYQDRVKFSFFLELDYSREAHGRPSSRIGRKMRGYDDFLKQWSDHELVSELPYFPPVLITTHGARRRDNLAQAVLRHRKRNVAYGLALTQDLLSTELNFLDGPFWLLIPTDSDEIIGLDSGALQPLARHKRWLASLSQNQRPMRPHSENLGRSGSVDTVASSQPIRPVISSPPVRLPPKSTHLISSSLATKSSPKPSRAARINPTITPMQSNPVSTIETGVIQRNTPNPLPLLPDSLALRQMRYISGLPILPTALSVFQPTVVPKTPQAIARRRQQKRLRELCNRVRQLTLQS